MNHIIPASLRQRNAGAGAHKPAENDSRSFSTQATESDGPATFQELLNETFG